MLQALRDEVIIKEKYQEKAGNIVIPKTAKKFQLYDGDIEYIVVSVGPDYPYPLKEGDRIIIQRHEGKPIVYKGERYFVMRERWVMGVIE